MKCFSLCAHLWIAIRYHFCMCASCVRLCAGFCAAAARKRRELSSLLVKMLQAKTDEKRKLHSNSALILGKSQTKCSEWHICYAGLIVCERWTIKESSEEANREKTYAKKSFNRFFVSCHFFAVYSTKFFLLEMKKKNIADAFKMIACVLCAWAYVSNKDDCFLCIPDRTSGCFVCLRFKFFRSIRHWRLISVRSQHTLNSPPSKQRRNFWSLLALKLIENYVFANWVSFLLFLLSVPLLFRAFFNHRNSRWTKKIKKHAPFDICTANNTNSQCFLCQQMYLYYFYNASNKKRNGISTSSISSNVLVCLCACVLLRFVCNNVCRRRWNGKLS